MKGGNDAGHVVLSTFKHCLILSLPHFRLSFCPTIRHGSARDFNG